MPLSNDNKEEYIKDQKVSVTKSVKSPIVVRRESINLEQDPYVKNQFYLTFEYTTLQNTSIYMYLNASFNQSEQCFIGNPQFPVFMSGVSRTPDEKTYIKFISNDIKLNIEQYLQMKSHDINLTDIILEMVNDSGDSFAIYAKIIPSNNNQSHKIKVEYLKFKFNGVWYNIYDVYGLANREKGEDADCEICCATPKNSIFLPCRHSYACKDCATQLRIRDPKCPVCRQKVTDSIVLDVQ